MKEVIEKIMEYTDITLVQKLKIIKSFLKKKKQRERERERKEYTESRFMGN
jgi:hypothetical protein